jgi:hypothetical protein
MSPPGWTLQRELQMPRALEDFAALSSMPNGYFFWHVEKAKFKVDLRRPSCDDGANISTKTLETLLLADHQRVDESDELREWRAKLDETDPYSDECLTHLRWPFRLSLSISEGNPRFYSICLKETDR